MEVDRSQGGLSPVMRRTVVFLLGGIGMLALGIAVQPRFKGRQVEQEEELLYLVLEEEGEMVVLDVVVEEEEQVLLVVLEVMEVMV